MICEEVRRRLDDAEGGTNPPDALAAHLESCADCHDYAEAAERLRAAASDLPTPAPGRDLWPGIAARLDRTAPRHIERRSRRHLWPLAASLVLSASLVVLLVARRGSEPEFTPVAEDRIHVVAWEDVISASQARAEEVLAARVGEMPEASQIALAENLERLDRAIREIRLAIEEHPENPRLEILLAARVQQHARLIQRISHV